MTATWVKTLNEKLYVHGRDPRHGGMIRFACAGANLPDEPHDPAREAREIVAFLERHLPADTFSALLGVLA